MAGVLGIVIPANAGIQAVLDVVLDVQLTVLRGSAGFYGLARQYWF